MKFLRNIQLKKFSDAKKQINLKMINFKKIKKQDKFNPAFLILF